MGLVETITIVLSLVALIVTVLGFFASLRFYRDGMQMQSRAERALAKIEERASAIQTQVGGMFDKTLDAVIGRLSVREAESQQSTLLVSSPPEAGSDPAVRDSMGERRGLSDDSPLAQRTGQYYSFRKLRITDVSTPVGATVFSIGSPAGFNLLDGASGYVFLGYFPQMAFPDVVARTRILFNNLDIAYSRLRDTTVDPILRSQAENLLEHISIELVVSDDIDSSALLRRLKEYQPSVRPISVAVRKAGDIEQAVADEYERMKQ
jgi:hypothetical protein